MDPRRGLQHEWRSRGGDGGGYGMLPSSSGRAIPPIATPSLSTGQGFYTVESLQGATMVPPPQPAPPPPRLLPPPEPYPRDYPPPRHSERLLATERGDFGPFDRRYPPAGSRKMMMMPPPDLPLSRRGEGMRGHGMLHHHPPPPFMGDPRMPGFIPGRRDPPLRGRWGPSGNYHRHLSDRGRDRDHDRDRSRPSQRIRTRKQGQKTAKPVSQAKSPPKSAPADKRSSADKQNAVEGGPGWCAVCKIDCLKADSLKKHVAGKRHKKQMEESQTQVENPCEKPEETKNEGEGITTATEEGAEKPMKSKDNEVGEKTAEKGGESAHNAAENMVIEDANGEGKSDATESAGTPKPATPIAGKKRAIKEVAQPKKKPRKPAASSDAPKATAVKGNEDTLNASNVLETSALDAQMKGADYAPCVKKPANSLKGDGNEPPVSGENLPSAEETLKGAEDGSKEVREVTDLANGKAGQSAEIQ